MTNVERDQEKRKCVWKKKKATSTWRRDDLSRARELRKVQGCLYRLQAILHSEFDTRPLVSRLVSRGPTTSVVQYVKYGVGLARQ